MSFWGLGVDELQPVEDRVLEGVLAGVECETSQRGTFAMDGRQHDPQVSCVALRPGGWCWRRPPCRASPAGTSCSSCSCCPERCGRRRGGGGRARGRWSWRTRAGSSSALAAPGCPGGSRAAVGAETRAGDARTMPCTRSAARGARKGWPPIAHEGRARRSKRPSWMPYSMPYSMAAQQPRKLPVGGKRAQCSA